MIQNALWSYWSKPLLEDDYKKESKLKFFLFSSILSFNTVKNYFKKTILVTDDFGKSLLIDGLELKFDEVSTELNEMNNESESFWNQGKFKAYLLQEEPFLHFDYDVFLWKNLPASLLEAPLIAQNKREIFLNDPIFDDVDYKIGLLKSLISNAREEVPVELAWYLKNRLKLYASSLGIFGGSNLQLIHDYSTKAMNFIRSDRNRSFWDTFISSSNSYTHTTIAEEFLLAAILEYNAYHSYESDISYLFDSLESLYSPIKAKEIGYTHLIGMSKSNVNVITRLENRIISSFPLEYEKCLNILSTTLV